MKAIKWFTSNPDQRLVIFQFDEFVKVSSDKMSGNVPQHPVSQHHLLQHRRDAIAGRSMEDAEGGSMQCPTTREFISLHVFSVKCECLSACVFVFSMLNDVYSAFWISISGLQPCWPACIGALWLNIPEGNFCLRAWAGRPGGMIFCGDSCGVSKQWTGLENHVDVLRSLFTKQVWGFVLFWTLFVQKLTFTNRLDRPDRSGFSIRIAWQGTGIGVLSRIFRWLSAVDQYCNPRIAGISQTKFPVPLVS